MAQIEARNIGEFPVAIAGRIRERFFVGTESLLLERFGVGTAGDTGNAEHIGPYDRPVLRPGHGINVQLAQVVAWLGPTLVFQQIVDLLGILVRTGRNIVRDRRPELAPNEQELLLALSLRLRAPYRSHGRQPNPKNHDGDQKTNVGKSRGIGAVSGTACLAPHAPTS